jgi:F-type H+-transporting ATPase subunit delta
MRRVETQLAKRYAQAFLNVFKDKISDATIETSEQLSILLKQHKHYLALLTVASCTPDIKQKILNTLLIKKGCLPRVYESLISLLIDHAREGLLSEVLHQIVQVYQQRHNILAFEIKSSHSVTDKELNGMGQFLAVQTGCDIIYTHRVDPSLIAGVRMESSCYVWEYSVRNSIKSLQNTFIHRERYG